VGRLASRVQADEAQFETEKADLLQQVLAARRGDFHNAYFDSAVARAKIE